MPFDPLPLSRPEFGFTMALQIVFASLAVGLASYVAVLEGLWLTTGTEAFQKLRSLWTKVLLAALLLAVAAAAVGAASGLGAAWANAADGFPYRPAQLVVSAVLATALVVGAVSAARLMRDAGDVPSCLALRMAIGMFVICAPLELALGDGASSRPRLVIGLAAAVALLGAWGAWLCWRGAPERSRLFLAGCILMGPVGLLAPIAEWLSAGRP
jgi:cytochrome d ubiquinol oxidase subunit I